MSEIQHLTRNYEISVWTLQDSFITVLAASDSRYKGRIQNPEMKLVNDGTQEFSFKILMYLDDGITRQLNPVWADIYNAPTIAGMRKIKVIFNKGVQDAEKVFEFLITKVTKIHENDEPYCEVNCEGLAFHELGKIGYKVELSTDVLVEENTKWYATRPKYENYTQATWSAAEQTWYDAEPRPTIDYWMTKVLKIKKYPTNGNINALEWYYKVQMDWSDYSAIGDIARESDKIYDEETTVAWTTELLPKNKDSIVSYKEKTRIIDEKESNIYNLTQKLAETFGVFCRYEYTYDDNYHISSRAIIFYNSGIKDKERKFSFTYPYSSTKISREDDCVDIVTKMYVTAIEDQSTESGLVTIVNSNANKTREDYLLNFDYLHEINTISDEQYDAIHDYEVAIRAKNDALEPLQDQLLIAEDRLPKAKALQTTAKNSMDLDGERINNSRSLAKALDMSASIDGTQIIISGANAKMVALLEESETTLYFTAPEKGIIANTIKLYDKDLTTGTSTLVSSGVPEWDEFGDFIKMGSIPKSPHFLDRQIAYITFTYSPKLYYEKVEKVWQTRLAKDTANYSTYTTEVNNLETKINSLKTQINTLIEEKKQLIKEFEILMGPALREGQWTPDNYDTTVGEKYVDFIQCSSSPDEVAGNTEYASFVWDTQPFDDELLGYYKLGADTVQKPYQCVLLTDTQVNFIKNNLDKQVGILYYDYKENSTTPANNPRYMRSLVINSSVIPAFVRYQNTIRMALILTGITNFTDDEINFIKSSFGQAKIGYLTIGYTNGNYTINPTIGASITSDQWLNTMPQIVYPRCKIRSLTLKNNETDLTISYNYKSLTAFEDYYVFQRIDQVNNNKYEGRYYITLKPMTLFQAGTLNAQLGIRYALSNASTSIYIDAKEILKENSKPKVTYTLDPNILQENFTYNAYNALNVIAFINDYELQFEGAQGYISTVNLNLDFPQEDTIEIKNYKNKFEDLFSTIVAQTQAMEKNEATMATITKIVSNDGSIAAPALEGALRKVDLNYSFNQGRLTISETEGIWGISDDGVVAYRGGGIFTATEKDENDNWIWNTGIVPQGINANLITSGQLDTNKIKVYAGDRIRFQLNGDGLFAYKSLFTDYDVLSTVNDSTYRTYIASRNEDANFAQYVTLNEDGLFLCARKGAYIVNSTHNGYRTVGNTETGAAISNFPNILNRVSITWDGLTLRNWNNDRVLYADANTGDLTVEGTIRATGIYISQNGSMQQVLFSVDTASHNIKLSSTNFDNLGANESSSIYITPTSIKVNSGGSISINGGSLTLSASANVDGVYKTVSGIDITSNGIDIQGNKYVKIRSGSNSVEITNSGITLNGNTSITGAMYATSLYVGRSSNIMSYSGGELSVGPWSVTNEWLYSGTGSICVTLVGANASAHGNAKLNNWALYAGAGWPESVPSGISGTGWAPFRIARSGHTYIEKLSLGNGPSDQDSSTSSTWTEGYVYFWINESGTWTWKSLTVTELYNKIVSGSSSGDNNESGSESGSSDNDDVDHDSWGLTSKQYQHGEVESYTSVNVPSGWSWHTVPSGESKGLSWFGDGSSRAISAWIQTTKDAYYCDYDGWCLFNVEDITIDSVHYDFDANGVATTRK